MCHKYVRSSKRRKPISYRSSFQCFFVYSYNLVKDEDDLDCSLSKRKKQGKLLCITLMMKYSKLTF